MVSRGFGFYESLFSLLLLFLGMILGIVKSSPSNSGFYGIIVLYLIIVA
jgi:hypothetical protein